ncbi:MAG: AAA family ATPase [Planctomycetia bacterium]|nr:AAA family ATPase [Planctomycetia bacterium]
MTPTLDQGAARQQALEDRTKERDNSIIEMAAYLSILRDHSTAKPEVREIRILGARDRDGRTDSGYFDDDQVAAKAAGFHDYNNNPHGTYITLNPCLPESLSKAVNRIRDFVGKGKTTSDNEIVVRRWLPLDIDPARPVVGIPATQEEYERAAVVREKLYEWLRGFGLPEMIEADSGNGVLLLLPVDLPNDDESKELCRRFLLACEQHREKLNWGEGAKIDCSMFNAARVSRLMGLKNRKGDNTPERPHRCSRVTFVPDYLMNGWREPVSVEKLQAVAALAEDPPPKGKPKAAGSKGGGRANEPPSNGVAPRYSRRLDISKWLTARGVEFTTSTSSGGTQYDVTCIQHDDHAAAFHQDADGKPGYHCFHDRCSGFGWEQASEKLGKPEADHFEQVERPASGQSVDVGNLPWIPAEGDWVKTKDRGNYGTVVCVEGLNCKVHFVSPEGQEAEVDYSVSDLEPIGRGEGKSRPPILRFSLREMQIAYPHLDPPVIDGLLREREILNLISVAKIGKSWLVYYILLCLATGREIFDRFATTPGKVLLIDNELPPSLLPFRIKTVANALGIQADEYHDKLDVWTLRHSPRSIFELSAEFQDIPPATYRLIALDAKYKALGEDADENSNSDEARFFAAAGVLAESTRSALMLVHHSTKGSQSDKRIVDIGAGGSSQARAADTHLVLREHEEPNCIVLAAALRSFEPVQPLGLRWEFPLWVVDESLDAEQLKGRGTESDQKQREKDTEAEAAVLECCQTWKRRRQIQQDIGMGPDRTNRAIARLRAAKLLDHEEQHYRGSVHDAFRKSIHAN